MALQTPGYYMPTWNVPQIQAPMQQQSVQQQQNNVIQVKAKEEALYYPVAPGNSIIFRKEDGSCIYIKTMGYSTIDPPIFEEYARVITGENKQTNANNYDTEISKLWGEINALKTKQNNSQSNGKNKDNGGN